VGHQHANAPIIDTVVAGKSVCAWVLAGERERIKNLFIAEDAE